MLAHIHPSRPWFTCRTRPFLMVAVIPAQSPGPATARQVPRAPLPASGVTLCAMASRTTSEGVTPPSSLVRAHAPDQIPPADFVFLIQRVFAGCRQSLLGDGPSRRYLRNPCMGAWTPTPGRLPGASTRFFPGSIGLTSESIGSARSVYRRNATSTTCRFRGCSHSVMFRLPYSLGPQVAPTARATIAPRAAGPFTPRNGPAVTRTNCGIATCLNRAIGTTGLSPAGLRPCRPLPDSFGKSLCKSNSCAIIGAVYE